MNRLLARGARQAWYIGRLPALAALAYLSREPLLDQIEGWVDLHGLTRFAVGLMSTPASRSMLACGAAVGLWATWTLLRRALSVSKGYLVFLAVAGVGMLAVFTGLRTPTPWALLPWLLLATNLLPDEILLKCPALRRVAESVARAVPAGGEYFFTRHYLRLALAGGSSSRREAPAGPGWRSAAVAAILAGATCGIVASPERLVRIEHRIRLSPAVEIVDRGNFNWIEVDRPTRRLLATGHGLRSIMAYSVDEPGEPLEWRSEPTAGAQGFALDSEERIIYAFDTRSRSLLALDADSGVLKWRKPLMGLSPGDPWLAFDRATRTLAIVSEADKRVGDSFLLLDLASLEVVDRRPLAAGNLLTHPSRPRLYLSFFRNTRSLLVYDLETRQVIAQTPTDARVDRMAFDETRNELLVASPLEARVLRYRADSLTAVGHWRTVFGVRSLALDTERDLLLVASLATGHLEVLDRQTGRRLQSFYVGPWLRTIALVPGEPTAFVSAKGVLYRVRYGE